MVGNIPNFTKLDVLRCFLRCNKNIGRQELARELELGEGTIRTILDLLKSKTLLDSTKKGHFLSKKGNETLHQIFEQITLPKPITMQGIYPQLKKICVLLRNAANLKELYKLRDIAVKNRADGAIILRFDNKLYAPESDYKLDYGELEHSFDFKKDDVLIITFSSDKRYAENGALAIAVELNGYLKEFISQC